MKVDEKMTNFLVASYFGEVTEANKPFKTGVEWEQIAWIKQAKYEA